MQHHIRTVIFDIEHALYTPGTDTLLGGFLSFARALKERGIRLCGWYTSEGAPEKLTPSVRELFDGFCCVTGDPDPEALGTDLKGFEEILHVPAFHCIAFSGTHTGIDGALAAHMKAVGVNEAMDAPEHTRDYTDVDVDFLLDSARTGRFPGEEWAISETVLRPRRAKYWESVFALTNGYMGLRGTHEEEDETIDACSYPGMFINGIYGHKPYSHAATFPGFPARLHGMLNATDWRIINCYCDGERVTPTGDNVSDYRRSLDMKRGVVVRSYVWTSAAGIRLRVETTRCVSMVRRHSAAIRYVVQPLNKYFCSIIEHCYHLNYNNIIVTVLLVDFALQ